MDNAVSEIASQVQRDGYAIIARLIDDATANRLTDAVTGVAAGEAGSLRHAGDLYGRRDILRGVAEVRALAGSPALMAVARSVLGEDARAVRGLWFDKTAGANWGVPWHQDMTVAVQARADVPGYGPWTVKAGVPHVRPPVAVLERMVTIRVHLDPCDAANGPLEVVPGSHATGRLDATATAAWLGRVSPVSCLVLRGGAVVMRPLILHASSAASEPGHRRVVHLEYATGSLAEPLKWLDAVGGSV